VKTYPCIVDTDNGKLQKNGLFGHTGGSLFFQRLIAGESQSNDYSYGTFVLSNHNNPAKKQEKNGNEVRLHGYDADKIQGKNIPSAEDSIVVENKVLKEIAPLLKINGTPIIIVNRMEAAGKVEPEASSKELADFLDTWRKSWESKDTREYLSFYSPTL